MSNTIKNGYPIKSFNGITVNTSLLSSSRNYYSYGSRNVKYIVMHYTGNPSDTAKANASYFNSGPRGASAHYFVDDTSCYQSVALNNAAWAVGGTSSYKHADCRNKNSISIEMCCFKNYTVSAQTEENAAHLCAELCKYIGIAADTVDRYVLRHWDVWSKDCPSGWTGSNNSRWNGFKDKVKAILKNESESLTMTQYEELKKELDLVKAEAEKMNDKMIYNYIDENMPEWAHESVQWCVNKGIIKGTGDGLGLTDDKLWMCVTLYRTAKVTAKLCSGIDS